MSLARTALRLQAIEALNSDPVILALVQGRVFDSRISALDHREPVPVILVTTEETKGEAWSVQNGGLPFKASCDLIIEIGMNALAEAVDEHGNAVLDGDGAPVQLIARATTDRELEAQLDLIEERAIAILTVGETPAAELLRSAIVRRVPRIASSRFATDQTGEKLAIHLLTLSVDFLNPEDDEPLSPPTGAYASLPEPLRTVGRGLDARRFGPGDLRSARRPAGTAVAGRSAFCLHRPRPGNRATAARPNVGARSR